VKHHNSLSIKFGLSAAAISIHVIYIYIYIYMHWQVLLHRTTGFLDFVQCSDFQITIKHNVTETGSVSVSK
jgi:hypothetical protein